jgi:hypothetical protein
MAVTAVRIARKIASVASSLPTRANGMLFLDVW